MAKKAKRTAKKAKKAAKAQNETSTGTLSFTVHRIEIASQGGSGNGASFVCQG